MSPWIQHVKNFAKAKGMKYNEALKSSECKNSYKKQKYFFCYYIIYNYSIIMSISSTGLYGSATIVNTDIFDDVQALKEEMVTLSTSYLQTTQEHREDISQNRLDISQNRLDISLNRPDISQNKADISLNRFDISKNRQDISQNKADISKNRVD